MANKSYASSEIGGDESRYGVDPEGSKDFKAAYQQVSNIFPLINDMFSWSRKSIKSKAIQF